MEEREVATSRTLAPRCDTPPHCRPTVAHPLFFPRTAIVDSPWNDQEWVLRADQAACLAHAGLPGQQGHGRGNQSTAEDPVDAGDAGGCPGLAPRLVVERRERDGNGSRAGVSLLDRPPCAAARAASDPLAHLVAARRARQER